MTTAVEAERGEIGADAPVSAAPAGSSGGLTTEEAAGLLRMQRQALYNLFNKHRQLFKMEINGGCRLVWTSQALETARTLLRQREARSEPDGRLSTEEVRALLDVSGHLLRKLQTSLGAQIILTRRGQSLRWPPEAVPLLREALAAWQESAAQEQSGVSTAAVAAQLGLAAERVLALRHLHRIPARRARRGLVWEPAAIERLREAARTPWVQPRRGPREGSSTREVAARVGRPLATVLSLVYRFPERLPVRKEDDRYYSWTAENVASLRALLAELPRRRDFLSTSAAATLLGIPYLRLVSLMRRRRDKLPLVKRDGFLVWSAEAVAIMRHHVARWRATAKDVQPLPQAAAIHSLPGRDFILVAPLEILLFSSPRLGVTARLADLDLQAQGAHPRDAVARLRRHLLLRYQELADQPLRDPGLWAGLQKVIAPRAHRKPARLGGLTVARSPGSKGVPVAVPPVIDPDAFERFEGFRETTLAVFTDPAANATLRGMADLQYTMGLEYSQHWPREPEGSFRHQARAVVADLRHLQGYLAFLGRQGEASELTPAEERISRKCRSLATGVRKIANAFEAELDAVREQAPRPTDV